MSSYTFREIWNQAMKTGQWKVALKRLEKVQPQSDYEYWRKIDFRAALLLKLGFYKECYNQLEEYKKKCQGNEYGVDNILKILKEIQKTR